MRSTINDHFLTVQLPAKVDAVVNVIFSDEDPAKNPHRLIYLSPGQREDK